MRGSRKRRRRLLPLLLFAAVVVVMVAVVAGVALGSTSTTLSPETSLPGADPQSESYKITAADLGGFGGKAPTLSSPSVIVESMDTGKVLFEHNSQKQRAMASTTKIMTAILVLESGKDLDSTVKVSANAAGTWEVSRWVRAGDVLTVKKLLYAMLLKSANGSAVALAENDAGSVSDFADKMNAKAEELGMKHTHFVTPNGLDAEGHYSTAADMAIVARYAMKNEQFRKLVDTKSYTLEMAGHDPQVLTNTNKLLTQYGWVTGVKTGSTPNGDYCLVSSGSKNGREVLAVVLGNQDSEARFVDSAALLQYGLNQFRTVNVIEKGVAVAEATVPNHADSKLELVTAGALATELTADQTATVTATVEKPLKLPVKAGDVYGHVAVTIGGKEVGKVDLVATKSFKSVTLGSKFAYYWHRLFS